MRTFTNTTNNNKPIYEKLSDKHKRMPVPMFFDRDSKTELESLEDTDTEKQFKKVNTMASRQPPRYLFKDYNQKSTANQTKISSTESAKKYKEAYEMEKLKYAEELNKYYY